MAGGQRALLGATFRALAGSARFPQSSCLLTHHHRLQLSQAYSRPAEEDGEGFPGVAKEAAEMAKNTVTAGLDMAANTIGAATKLASNMAAGITGGEVHRPSDGSRDHLNFGNDKTQRRSSMVDPFVNEEEHPMRDTVKSGIDMTADAMGSAATPADSRSQGYDPSHADRTRRSEDRSVRDSMKQSVDAAADTINSAAEGDNAGRRRNHEDHPVRDTVKAGIDTAADTINAATEGASGTGRGENRKAAGQAGHNHPARDAVDPVRDVDRL